MDKNSVILITGGTGSFGNAVCEKLLSTSISEIRIFSRDEKKQDEMRNRYSHSKLKFYLGDVRDRSSLTNATRGVDFVFHAAALKQVPSCEFYPLEAVKTNVLGTENLIEAAVYNGVKKVVCLSTDKAVYPINAMGISKALMEKVAIAKARNIDPTKTIVCCTRYGNVLASRGSVLPRFIEQVLSGQPITITNPNMTRFIMTLDNAVDLVNYAFKNGKNGDLFVQKSPATSIEKLCRALKNFLDVPEHPVDIIGTRHGEKLFEALLSREEMMVAEDLGSYYRIPADIRDLNYDKYVASGTVNAMNIKDYNSHNAEQLDEPVLQGLFEKIPYLTNARQKTITSIEGKI